MFVKSIDMCILTKSGGNSITLYQLGVLRISMNMQGP